MHCCARNIVCLTRIPELRTDLQWRFVACSFHPLKSAIHELAIWPGPLLAVLSAISNDCAFVQKIVATLQLGENELRSNGAEIASYAKIMVDRLVEEIPNSDSRHLWRLQVELRRSP